MDMFSSNVLKKNNWTMNSRLKLLLSALKKHPCGNGLNVTEHDEYMRLNSTYPVLAKFVNKSMTYLAASLSQSSSCRSVGAGPGRLRYRGESSS